MPSWRGLSDARDCLRGTDSVMVSVYVQQSSMPSRGLFRTSRQRLLKTSILSVIVIVLAFFIIYAILLAYVDLPFQKAQRRQYMFPGIAVYDGRSRVRLLGKRTGSRNETPLLFGPEISQRKAVWDPGQFNDPASEAPKCRQGSLFIIVITSSPDHFEHRTAIRNTWCSAERASDHSAWQCMFLIGQTSRTDTNAKLSLESQRFHDILQGNYEDSYRNLTLKVMHGMSWLSKNCEVSFVLKTDDDCFVNAELFRQFLIHHNTKTTNLYAGNMLTNKNRRKVIRRQNEKWSVSQDDYLPEYYPIYASGSGYALSSDIVTKLAEESRFHKPIPNEDAYIGIVMDSLGVPPTNSGRFTLSSAGLRVCNYLYIFLAHGVEPGMQKELQRNSVAASSECKDDEEVTGWF